MAQWLFTLLMVLVSTCAQAETIIINAEDDWAPFSSLDRKNGAPQGFAVDVVRAAFASQGITVQFRAVPFTRCLREVQANQALACFNIEKTGYNAQQFHWHATPLLEEPLAIFARTPYKRRLTADDLAGRRVALTRDYTYPSSLLNQPGLVKDYARTDEQQLRKLLAGRVDFAIINAHPARLLLFSNRDFLTQVHEVGQVNVAQFYVGFAPQHPSSRRYAELLDKGLATLRANGQYAAMQRQLQQQLATAP
ncbi:substrate-binding periplasmic protein [Chitinilyticum litopenaei]|uniref:substrate-binding periplasmic protein n=1 Tax=Chitinilyticum litopenaei TaxID=1121276 RepID=UPI0004057987|nr:transporter substrate-binding domain-containing protein [Chitinilyticum litopenaei]